MVIKRDLSDQEGIDARIAELFALKGEARQARLATLADELRKNIAYFNRRMEQQHNTEVASAYAELANDCRAAMARVESIAALPLIGGL